ncbi:unnamed protein product [Penicillium olsonii]|uniref:FHA domain-containing protein n=1 Tax=Penicillium olsonii TaxID=99116 RepID=A0A9W4MPW7_PENOL|nr:unnamed protein product [Penicillium olsonii]CAG8171993.1 unnamed protein product [Penicillium olsonii]
MWVLDSTGDFLEGKRIWLRPGKKYLFGRFQREGVRHAVNHNSISRKHMTIEISPVKPKDGLSLRARSGITVTDLASKKGTVVDGTRIEGEHKLEKNDEHFIQLAKYEHKLRIKWEPVVLSFSLSSKEMRGEDPLAHVRSRLEDLDVKTVVDYIVDKTTYVVSSKRNTAKGLQALVNGKYIVDDTFIDALVYAATPNDLENLESLCRLEIDFESEWPDPRRHLPPAGKENIDRPSTAFAPNLDRRNIFDQYTFVFCDQSQFDNLQGPINNGQGKALFFDISEGSTTAVDIVRFMEKAAGNQGVGAARHGPGGVVLVRFRSKGEFESWALDVGNEVALMTDQRVIEQREFLDAILGNDASPLCRSLPTEEGSSQAPASPAITTAREVPSAPVISAPASPVEQEPTPPSASRHRSASRPYVSKMKNFDDGFDMESVPTYAPEEEESAFDTQTMDTETQAAPEPVQPLDTVKEEPQDDMVSDLLPGARAMKRRRSEMAHHPEANVVATETEPPKRKRAKLDVLEAARKHREEEEEQHKMEQDPHLDKNDLDVSQLRNLAIVEEMDLPVRKPPVTEDQNTDRWDDRWNGRKNFKKFRRKGETGGRSRMQAVIVPLDEVTRKEYGVGDHYWSGNAEPVNPVDTQNRSSVQESNENPPLRSEESASTLNTPQPDPEPAPSRRPKRARETRDSDSDDGTRFRFRRKR